MFGTRPTPPLGGKNDQGRGTVYKTVVTFPGFIYVQCVKLCNEVTCITCT
jgi:hypothetical protein